MKKTGLADSPFFSERREGQKKAVPPPGKTSAKKKKKKKRPKKADDTKKPGNHDTVTPRNHDATVSRYRDTIIEVVRKAVKDIGKEAATHRFTAEEKEAIAEVIYAYKRKDIRTSENEITRIAVNFIINDHKDNGEESILDRVLKALNE